MERERERERERDGEREGEMGERVVVRVELRLGVLRLAGSEHIQWRRTAGRPGQA